MATGGAEVGMSLCPLCQAPMESQDQLQLHYLTSCSGYDRDNERARNEPLHTNEQTLPPSIEPAALPTTTSAPMPTALPTRANPTTTPSSVSSTATVTTVPQAKAATVPGNSTVQFMWQPLTEITYPKITLLASFELGPVELSLDPEGSYYASELVTIATGTYEGQLVIGDSFVHPVKEFTIEKKKNKETIVLQFEVTGTGHERAPYGDMYTTTEGGYGTTGQYGTTEGRYGTTEGHYGTTEGRYGSGLMQTNPSYRGYGGGPAGHQASFPSSQGDYSRYQDSDINEPYGGYPSGEGGRARAGAGGGGRYGTTELGAGGGGIKRKKATSTSYRTPPDGLEPTTDFGFHQYPGTGRSHSPEHQTPSEVPSDAHQPTVSPDRTEPPTIPGTHSNFATSTYSSPPSASGFDSTTARTNDTLSSLSLDKTGYSMTAGSTFKTTTSRADASPFSIPQTTEHDRNPSSYLIPDLDIDDEINDINAPTEVLQAGSQTKQYGEEDKGRQELEVRVFELQDQHEEMKKERDGLRQAIERSNAQHSDEVSQLRKQLLGRPQQQGSTESREAARTAALDREKARAAKELRELKDQNAALQEQLNEYAGAINDQNKVIHGQMATSKVIDAERLRNQQLHVQYGRFMKKQQLEYGEAISSLKKQQLNIEGRAQEKIRLQQLNLQLTGELEDYRTQTKRLLVDLQSKDADILQLRQQLSRNTGSERDHLELELETMKQKCDGWRHEVERLSPLREELQQAQALVSQLQEEIQQLSSDNEGLGDQLRASLSEVGGDTRKQAEMARKASEYDVLLERLTELQQVRANLENELGPLREERAAILRENAHMKEGSDPANYVKLKEEYATLTARSEELQRALEQEKDLVQMHEKTNQQLKQRLTDATNPEQLQSISDRMERYRQERDQARQQQEEAEGRLQVFQMDSDEKLTEALQTATEESDVRVAQLQNDLAMMQKDITSLSAKSSEYQTKCRRYREERNQFKATCDSLEHQVADLRSALDNAIAQSKAQPYPSLDSMAPDSTDYTPYHQAGPGDTGYTDSTPASPPQGQGVGENERMEGRTYSPQRYSTEEDPHVPMESPVSLPLPKAEGKRQIPQKPRHSGSGPRSLSSSSSSLASSTAERRSSSAPSFLVDVKTKEGISRLWLQKPDELPNFKWKPQIVVKRAGSQKGTYETGRLMFVGRVGDKMLAGIQLDLPDGNNDGTLKKDGKRYFKCEPSYGLYVPPDKVYLEIGDATASV